MNASSPLSDRDKTKAQIKKLLALSKSPFKAEADSALRKAKALMKLYDLGKTKVLHPQLNEYEMLLYRALCEGVGGVWNEKFVYGVESTIKQCLNYVSKCISEIDYGVKECEKTLSQNNKNAIGVEFWYKKGFYNGLCEGLNVRVQYVNLIGTSHLDYGSQLFVYNHAYSHAMGIGKYYAQVNHRKNG